MAGNTLAPAKRASKSSNSAPSQARPATHDFGAFCPTESWQPAVNVYQLANALEVCMDLAGTDPGSITITLCQQRLVIRGERQAPQPDVARSELKRIETMEIDCGRFSREIELPQPAAELDMQRWYRDGLLWVRIRLA